MKKVLGLFVTLAMFLTGLETLFYSPKVKADCSVFHRFSNDKNSKTSGRRKSKHSHRKGYKPHSKKRGGKKYGKKRIPKRKGVARRKGKSSKQAVCTFTYCPDGPKGKSSKKAKIRKRRVASKKYKKGKKFNSKKRVRGKKGRMSDEEFEDQMNDIRDQIGRKMGRDPGSRGRGKQRNSTRGPGY